MMPAKQQSVCLATLTLWGTLGCQMTSQQQKKVESEAQWKQVRSDVKYRLAVQQFEGGLMEEAGRTIEEALALNGKSAELYILLARVRLESGDLSASRAAAEQALVLDSSDADAHYTLGTIEERAMNPGEALHHFTQAAELNPQQIDYVTAKAECLVAVGQIEAARSTIIEARNRFPREASLEVLGAQVAVILKLDDEAALGYRRALDLLGDHAQTAEQYALVLTRLGRHAEAVSVLRKLVADKEAQINPTVARTLALGYQRVGKPEQGAEILDRYLRDHSDDRELWGLRAQIGILADRPDDVRRCIVQLDRLTRGHPDLDLLRAYLLWREGQVPKARTLLETQMGRHEGTGWVHWLYGAILVDVSEIEPARQQWLRALQLDPELERARQGLARLPGATVLAAMPGTSD